MAKTRRATRIKAAELAAHIAAARELSAATLFGYVVFFELYIDHGGPKTEEMMHLLGSRKIKKLRIIAGGNLK